MGVAGPCVVAAHQPRPSPRVGDPPLLATTVSTVSTAATAITTAAITASALPVQPETPDLANRATWRHPRTIGQSNVHHKLRDDTVAARLPLGRGHR